MKIGFLTVGTEILLGDTVNTNLTNLGKRLYDNGFKLDKDITISDQKDEIDKALKQKNNCSKEVDDIFKDYDFLVLPSAQVFPFDKNLQFPKKINNHELDTYHRWIEVFIMSSLLDLPTITVPVGFNENGMPMGMQIIAKKYDDLRLFAFTKRYEEMFNSSKIKPIFEN